MNTKFFIAPSIVCIALLLTGSLFLFPGCSLQPAIIEVPQENIPSLFDDDNPEKLLIAAQQHLRYLKSLPQKNITLPGNFHIETTKLISSLERFIEIIAKEDDPQRRSDSLKKNFRIFQIQGEKQHQPGKVLVTGYYEPVFAGNLTPTPWFKFPVYRKPDDLVVDADKKTVTRYDPKGILQPYWTRTEIENQQKLAGYEIAYLHDPFDAFLLQVQGSGKIQLPDGTIKNIRFAGHNGHPYASIGKLLIDEGKLSRKSVSVPTIRAYLKQHPKEQRRILQHNPRVIFFTWGTDDPPVGSMNVPLTAEHSIAIDPSALPAGLIGYLLTQKPDVADNGAINGWSSLGRFVFPQDTGSAIRGANRVDLFWGNSTYAEIAAGSMKHQGQLYFLLAK